MGSGKFYSRMANFKENVKRYRFSRGVFLSGLLLLIMHFNAKAQVFAGGSSQSFTICEGSAGYDFSSLMVVNDTTSTYTTETYTVYSMATIGTASIAGGSAIVPLTSGTATPSPATFFYVPTPGMSGNDVFIIAVTDGSGVTVYDTIYVTVNALPTITLVNPNITVCAGTLTTALNFTGLSSVGPVTTVFSTVGDPTHPYVSWSVPAGITSLTFDVQGGAGSADDYSATVGDVPNPGLGGRIQGFFSVTPGEQLNIFVGGQGGLATNSGAIGGYNGGGNAYYYPLVGFAGGTGGAGGGASDIRVGGVTLANRVIVAGGGGGNGWDGPYGAYYGGAGGGTTGGASQANVEGSSAGGGTNAGGGLAATRTSWPSGTNGTMGQGGDGSPSGGVAGGGGGGYYGGGGGVWNGGGGGSSYSDPTQTSLITNTQGYNPGNGVVALTYNIPGTYTITWLGGAHGDGFTDVTAALPTSPITVSIPSTAVVGTTYTGIVTVSNGSCTSMGDTVNITINATPNVSSVAPQAICNGMNTTLETFSGSYAGTLFSWTCDNTSFGLPSNGTDSVSSITVNNGTVNPEIANITVVPSLAGCTGASTVFTITGNPTPVLSSTLNPDSICSGNAFGYTPACATPGIVNYSWMRSTPMSISPASASGTGAISESSLTNSSNITVGVTYSVTLSANSCTNTQMVNLNVEPTPMLFGSTAIAPTGCGTEYATYTPASLVAGTTYMWTRNVVTGVTNPVGSGTGGINDTLNNISPNQVTVTYNYTLMANGCPYYQNVTALLNPMPKLTSSLTNAPICSGANFEYMPLSTSGDETFNWVNGTTSGSNMVNEVLTNSTPNPITETFDYTVTAYGCTSMVYPVTVVVNPKPTLNSSLTPAGICDNVPFMYTPTSLTAGTAFYWSRPAVTGISQSAEINVGSINEMLTNTTTSPVAVNYVFTLDAAGCFDTQTVSVWVNPAPVFTGNLTPPAQCDSLDFNYSPMSSTSGATYNWSRAYVPGILAPARSGTGNPGELLINTTNVNVNATYQYIATANGCSSNPANVVVTVHPTAKLSSSMNEVICTNVPFSYTPTSFTPGASFTWTRPEVNGITPGTNYGNGGILETLDNSTGNPITVEYNYLMSAYGCTNPTPAHMKLIVNPAPVGSQIASGFASSVCSNTNNQSFNAVSAPANGVKYTWSAQNAVIWETSQQAQYALVNFPNSGDAVITLTSTVEGTGCNGSSSVTVNVSNSVADNPMVIYYQGMFVCLENDEDSYQWGYDNAIASITIPGAINQSFIDAQADFVDNNYWVITTHNGCTQKTYYNPPAANYSHRSSANILTIYPNPVTSTVNLEFSNGGNNTMEYEVINMLGQKLITGNGPQAAATIDASGLPAGCYFINCYDGGVKIATTRFIKK